MKAARSLSTALSAWDDVFFLGFSHGYFTSRSFWIACSAPPKARARATLATLWAKSAEISVSFAAATDSCACTTSILSVRPAENRSRA